MEKKRGTTIEYRPFKLEKIGVSPKQKTFNYEDYCRKISKRKMSDPRPKASEAPSRAVPRAVPKAVQKALPALSLSDSLFPESDIEMSPEDSDSQSSKKRPFDDTDSQSKKRRVTNSKIRHLDPTESKPPKNLDAICDMLARTRSDECAWFPGCPNEAKYRAYVQKVRAARSKSALLETACLPMLNEYSPSRTPFGMAKCGDVPHFVGEFEFVKELEEGEVAEDDDASCDSMDDASCDSTAHRVARAAAALLQSRDSTLSSIGETDPPGHSHVISFVGNGSLLTFFAHYARKHHGTTYFHQYPIRSVDLTSSYKGFVRGTRHLRNAQDYGSWESRELGARVGRRKLEDKEAKAAKEAKEAKQSKPVVEMKEKVEKEKKLGEPIKFKAEKKANKPVEKLSTPKIADSITDRTDTMPKECSKSRPKSAKSISPTASPVKSAKSTKSTPTASPTKSTKSTPTASPTKPKSTSPVAKPTKAKSPKPAKEEPQKTPETTSPASHLPSPPRRSTTRGIAVRSRPLKAGPGWEYVPETPVRTNKVNSALAACEWARELNKPAKAKAPKETEPTPRAPPKRTRTEPAMTPPRDTRTECVFKRKMAVPETPRTPPREDDSPPLKRCKTESWAAAPQVSYSVLRTPPGTPPRESAARDLMCFAPVAAMEIDAIPETEYQPESPPRDLSQSPDFQTSPPESVSRDSTPSQTSDAPSLRGKDADGKYRRKRTLSMQVKPKVTPTWSVKAKQEIKTE